jgi:alpha-D-ribose 1-methylphosphonate 5-triphosphate synthase subunit PhnG
MPQVDTESRQRWLSLLGRARRDELEQALTELAATPRHTCIRTPETGMVMVRGRTGGTGQRFNLGEMTVTRASVRLDDGTVGHGYVAGRDRERARLAAILDGVLQSDSEARRRLQSGLLARVAARVSEQHRRTRRQAAATRVEFFTLAREGSE